MNVEEQLKLLYDAAKECANDLEVEVKARYGYPDVHPSQKRKFLRDMQPVYAVRTILREIYKSEKENEPVED